MSMPERLGAAPAACWEIQLWRVSFTRFAAARISYLLTSSTSPSQQRSARCKWACEGLGLQVGASMMCCKIYKQSRIAYPGLQAASGVLWGGRQQQTLRGGELGKHFKAGRARCAAGRQGAALTHLVKHDVINLRKSLAGSHSRCRRL